MAYILNLTTHSDNRGNLTVIENQIPFPIKRIFMELMIPSGVATGIKPPGRQQFVCTEVVR